MKKTLSDELAFFQNYSRFLYEKETSKRPFVFILKENFLENLQLIKSYSKNKSIRFATKSIRSIDVLKWIEKEWGQSLLLMTYDIRETKTCIENGFRDCFLAYPTFDEAGLLECLKVVQEKSLQGENVKLSLCIDHEQQIEFLVKVIGKLNLPQPIGLIIDIDSSLKLFGQHIGVKRSSLLDENSIRIFFEKLKTLEDQKDSFFYVAGLMTYDAQIAGLPDQSLFHFFRNPLAKWIRKFSFKKLNQNRKQLNQLFKHVFGRDPDIHNGGGSGSLNWSERDPSLTEITAGSALYASHLFDGYSNISFKPSLFIALPVTRKPDSNTIVCQEGGYIASGTPGWDRLPLPVFPTGLQYLKDEGAGEVQTPLSGEGAPDLNGGDFVFFRSSKAGEVLKHFKEIQIVSKRNYNDSIKNVSKIN